MHYPCCRTLLPALLLYTFLAVTPVRAAEPTIAGCPLLPADNIWNAPVDSLPVATNSEIYIDTIGRTTTLHPDFGSGTWNGGPIGIPYNVVAAGQALSTVTFLYGDESDPGPYPIPESPLIEGGPDSDGDRHILIVDTDGCRLYELYDARPETATVWSAGSGAIYDLNSNALRPDGWTSADAAGLPILPGLVRFEEVAAGSIDHALRFTAARTRNTHLWPARHHASSLSGSQYPPMGQRFRLKAGVDLSGFSPQVQVIARAMQKYGLILADNGSNWYITGVPDERWDNDILRELGRLSGNDFEAVDVSGLMMHPDSGGVKPGEPPPPAGKSLSWLMLLLSGSP
ncbi:MAG: hypothetical protein ACYC9M_11015 [Desulfobulbaceae bacterium]